VRIVCSGQDMGNAVWPMLSALTSRASSIKVRDGTITLGSSLHPEGKSILELSGKNTLGRDGALKLAKILSESAMPSVLTALDIRQEMRTRRVSGLFLDDSSLRCNL
jgi:hypothetical protein